MLVDCNGFTQDVEALGVDLIQKEDSVKHSLFRTNSFQRKELNPVPATTKASQECEAFFVRDIRVLDATNISLRRDNLGCFSILERLSDNHFN